MVERSTNHSQNGPLSSGGFVANDGDRPSITLPLTSFLRRLNYYLPCNP